MCGICGFCGNGDHQVVADMLSKMQYRGPDGNGQWKYKDRVFFGHNRLSIVDLVTGDQPLSTTDGEITVVFNGEIYNHQELRKRLEALGHKFQTVNSDTEVLLHGYRQWGRQLVEKLNGMWAFAIYDVAQNLVWLSRDRFGKKPLFYSYANNSFVFSSELRSLLVHPDIPKQINETALIKYFALGYVPSPLSLVDNVLKVPAGHNLVYSLSNRKVSIERYWRYTPRPDHSLLEKQDKLATDLIDRLYSAVSTRMSADVPVGVFLSGGIDSSAITSLAVSSTRNSQIKSFSIGFKEESFDESGYAKDVAKIFGSNHHQDILSAWKCQDLLGEIYGRLDEPMADSSLVPSFLMCRLAATHVKVGLGGDGADELFAGYDPFRALRPATVYNQFVPKLAHYSISKMAGRIPVSHRNMSFDFKLKKFLSGLGYDRSIINPIWLGPLPPAELGRVFGRDIRVEEVYSEAIDAWDSVEGTNLIDKTIQFYVELYLQNGILTKMDRAGMLNSIEVRSPFLDKDLIELVETIPAELKFDGKSAKKILKHALKKVLPQEIIKRPKKGFGMPVGGWFNDGRLRINESALGPHLDSSAVKKIYRDHRSNKADWRGFLWAYYCLEQWMAND
jgi:asparagine synthase (glutamine-hydrolysing)